MKSCLLLDMGGVVLQVGTTEGLPQNAVDFRGRQAMLALLAQAGARLTLEDLDALLFSPWRLEHVRRYDAVRDAAWEPHLDRLLRAAGVELDRWELLDAWFRPYAEQLVPEPGAAEALAELRRMGKRLAIVSNTPLPGRFYTRVLDRYELAGYFDAMYFSYDLGTRKPSPSMLRRALAGFDAEPQEAMMVGDRRGADIAAGRTAGIETVWVRSAFEDGPPAHHEIDALADLPALVASREGILE